MMNEKNKRKNAKKLALEFVWSWATLNHDNLDEDWYNEMFDERTSYELTEQDKIWAREEFRYLSNLLMKRWKKYYEKLEY